jgi:hypothetical protein
LVDEEESEAVSFPTAGVDVGIISKRKERRGQMDGGRKSRLRPKEGRTMFCCVFA